MNNQTLPVKMPLPESFLSQFLTENKDYSYNFSRMNQKGKFKEFYMYSGDVHVATVNVIEGE